MTALAQLTDEEEALFQILMDPTGVDIAEFLLEDMDTTGDPLRLWPFQWPWTHSGEKYEVDQLARQTGKSQSVVWKAMAHAFQNPGQEMLLVAPQLNHLELLTAKIEQAFNDVRLLNEMRPKTASKGLKKSPHWQMTFLNAAQIISRLASSPAAMKGPHPVVIEGDEVQDWIYESYLELIETVKTNHPNMSWRMHGVSKGVGRDLHFRLTQGEIDGSSFHVHHYIAAHRPTWTDEERQAKIKQYGGDESHPDYQRNVLGLPADAGTTLFVAARLMACVRIQESEWAVEYNNDVYRCVKISDALLTRVRKHGQEIESLIDVPISHLRDEYVSYWAGADIGFTNDPTEILVFGTTRKGVDRLLLRVQLERITAKDQVAVVKFLFDSYGSKLKRFGLDRTGVGLPLFQDLRDVKDISSRVVGYNFSENRAVEFDDRDLKPGEKQEDLVIKRNIKDHATDLLRKSVDQQKLELPYDKDILTEWGGATSYIIKTNPDDDGTKRRYGGGSLHTLDAARMYAAAKGLMAIEEMLNAVPKQEDVIDQFVYF